MKVVLAPDSFKGSLSATDVCAAMRLGVMKVWPQADIVELPLGDGGEGTMACLVAATLGRMHETTVFGPMGKPIQARYAILGDGRTAVIECAEAAGLTLVPEADRNPGIASTYGVGQLMLAALEHPIDRLIVCLGGSGTQDGGAGMLQALGVRLLDKAGKSLEPGGLALCELHGMEWDDLDPRLDQVQVLVACDVDTPLCGPQGTSPVFAPQKGADSTMVEQLSRAMDQYAAVARQSRHMDIADTPGGGAAGGLGAGLLLGASATLQRGIDIVLDTVRFSQVIQGATLILTGEGRLDGQSVLGKTIWGVVQRSARASVPVVALVGGLGEGYEALYEMGLSAAFSIVDKPMTLTDATEQAPHLVERTSQNIARLVVAGTRS